MTPRPGLVASVLMLILEFRLLSEFIYDPANSVLTSSLEAVSMAGRIVLVMRSASSRVLVVGFAPAERMEKPTSQSGMRTRSEE